MQKPTQKTPDEKKQAGKSRTAKTAQARTERPLVKGAAAKADLRNFDLSWHLPHLLRRAHFEAEACFAGIYGDVATSRQLALLVALAQAPGATQAEVARSIGLDANTCSDLVRRAVAKGWLQRSRVAHDGRAYRLDLLPAGLALVGQTALPLAEPYSARVAGRLTPKQRHQLAELLRIMLALHSASSKAP